jgi:hypothetical protein
VFLIVLRTKRSGSFMSSQDVAFSASACGNRAGIGYVCAPVLLWQRIWSTSLHKIAAASSPRPPARLAPLMQARTLRAIAFSSDPPQNSPSLSRLTYIKTHDPPSLIGAQKVLSEVKIATPSSRTHLRERAWAGSHIGYGNPAY